MALLVTFATLKLLNRSRASQPFWLILDLFIYLLTCLSQYLKLSMLTEQVPGEEVSASGSSSHMGSQAGDEEDRTAGKTKFSKGERKKIKRRKKALEAAASFESALEEDKAVAKDKDAPMTAAAAAPAGPSAPSSFLPKTPKSAPADAKPKAKAKGSKMGKKGGFTSEQMGLLTIMIKMVLQLSQKSREMESVTFDTYLAPSDHPLVAAMRVQGRRYSHAVQSTGHGLAAPHLYIFGALLDSIATHTGEEQDRQHRDQYNNMATDQRGQIIRLCKVAKLFRAEEMKVALAFGSGAEAQSCKRRVLEVLGKITGWSYKVGKPPTGYMEKTLASYLEELVD